MKFISKVSAFILRELENKICFMMSVKYFIVTFFLLSIASFSQNIEPVTFWQNRFDDSWAKEYEKALPMSTSNDSWQFYNLSYYIDANVVMYEVSKDQKYLNRALLYVNNMLNSATESKKLAKSQYKDTYMGWANYTAPSYKNDQKEYPLFESYCWRYVTDLLFLMKKNGLDRNLTYQKQYNAISNFTINNIYNKWLSRGKSNLYRSNAHMMSHWVKISMNLYLITGDTKYKAIIADFLKMYRGNQEKTSVSSNVSSIKWKAAWNKKGQYQDVAHGNAVVDLLIHLYDNDLGVNEAEIKELVTLFDKIIWKSKNSYAEYIDGTGNGSGWFTDGYIKLGRYDASLQKRIENHTKGRSTQFFANGALNAKYLLSKK